MNETNKKVAVLLEHHGGEEMWTATEAARVPHQKREDQRAGEVGSAPMTAKEVISLATSSGWTLETGGKHPKLVNKDGRKVAIPVHGGAGRNLATGTLKTILKIIKGET